MIGLKTHFTSWNSCLSQKPMAGQATRDNPVSLFSKWTQSKTAPNFSSSHKTLVNLQPWPQRLLSAVDGYQNMGPQLASVQRIRDHRMLSSQWYSCNPLLSPGSGIIMEVGQEDGKSQTQWMFSAKQHLLDMAEPPHTCASAAGTAYTRSTQAQARQKSQQGRGRLMKLPPLAEALLSPDGCWGRKHVSISSIIR